MYSLTARTAVLNVSRADAAIVTVALTTDPEIKRLEEEERDLEGVATVKWVQA